MSQPINIASLYRLIEEDARAAGITLAHAEIMAANMDLNANKAAEAHQNAVRSLLGNAAALQRILTPKDPSANGRISLAG